MRTGSRFFLGSFLRSHFIFSLIGTVGGDFTHNAAIREHGNIDEDNNMGLPGWSSRGGILCLIPVPRDIPPSIILTNW